MKRTGLITALLLASATVLALPASSVAAISDAAQAKTPRQASVPAAVSSGSNRELELIAYCGANCNVGLSHLATSSPRTHTSQRTQSAGGESAKKSFVVPEPAGFVALVTGLVSLLGIRRRV